MTAEQEILTSLVSIQRMLGRLVDSMPPMSRKEFAARIGRSPNTITKWIREGKIRTKDNRIPYSQLEKVCK